MSTGRTASVAEIWGEPGEGAQQSRLGSPDVVAGAQDAPSPGFYFRLAGDNNVFFATGRMLSQTELLIGQDEGLRNVEPVVVTVCFPAGAFSLLSLSHVYFWLLI